MKLKQVIIVRKDLNMRKGKMIAQGAHASLTAALNAQGVPQFMNWMASGQKKIAVSVSSEKELGSVYQQAKEAGMPCSIITDAGHTEFKGVPTKTAVAIGPWDEDEIDEITGSLSLL